MQLEPIRAVLTADSAHFVSGMSRARGSLDNLSITSGRSHRAMNVLKSGMVGLATQATGTAGPVGKLAQGLLMFGGGSTLILAVAAGIGALAIAYQSLTAESRAAEKATNDLIASLQKIGVHGELVAARIELGKLQEKLRAAETVLRNTPQSPSAAARVVELQSQIATKLIEIARHQQDVAKWQKGIADDAEREAEARARTASLLRVVAEFPTTALGESLFQRDQARLRGQVGADIAGKETARLQGDFFKFAARDIFLQSGISETVRSFGISVGRQFIMGMLEGIESMQDLLKMVLMSVLDFGIGMILNSIIPGGGSIVGSAKGTDVIPKVGPAQMSLNMNMGGLQPLTVFAISRDPAFQQVIREAILVAGSQGFKS